MKPHLDEAAILAIERPHKALWTYYLLGCLVIPPLFPILILPAWFRYHTMRYKFSDEGISMRWGILFRREIILNYARIQDIHLQSNIIERWLGLARILVQTASGSASAEMTIEGLKEFELVRDFLYFKMRGVRDAAHHVAPVRGDGAEAGHPAPGELAAVLHEIADEVRALRAVLENQQSSSGKGESRV